MEAAEAAYIKQEEENGPENMREAERVILLKVVDKNGWITSMLWISCGRNWLKAYGQKDPVIEYAGRL